MWANESVFYQIYPFGACGAPFENDHVLTHRIHKLEDFIPLFYDFMSVYRHLKSRLNVKMRKKKWGFAGFLRLFAIFGLVNRAIYNL